MLAPRSFARTFPCGWLLALAAACLPFLSACGSTPSPTGQASSTRDDRSSSSADAKPAAGAAAAPVLVIASWKETQDRIARAQGKVVVVDFWSTWCTPCIREFPELVKLHEKYPDDVVCLSVNCNFTGAEGESPDDARGEIEAFLVKQRAHFTHVLCTDPDLPLLEKLGAAAVPVVQVYDQAGRLQKQFTNDDGDYGEEGFEYAKHVEPLVKQLLHP